MYVKDSNGDPKRADIKKYNFVILKTFICSPAYGQQEKRKRNGRSAPSLSPCVAVLMSTVPYGKSGFI